MCAGRLLGPGAGLAALSRCGEQCPLPLGTGGSAYGLRDPGAGRWDPPLDAGVSVGTKGTSFRPT